MEEERAVCVCRFDIVRNPFLILCTHISILETVFQFFFFFLRYVFYDKGRFIIDRGYLTNEQGWGWGLDAYTMSKDGFGQLEG